MAFPSERWEDLRQQFEKPVFFKLRDELFSATRYNEFYSKFEMEQEMYAHLFNTRPVSSFTEVEDGKEETALLIATTGTEKEKEEKELAASKQIEQDEDMSREQYLLRTAIFLRNHGIKKLRDQFAIRTLPHALHPNLIHLSATVHTHILPYSILSFVLLCSHIQMISLV